MTDNRRNLYRVLHVQPDAPTEVIRSSWRTLLGRLRQHPDLGGTHAQAVLVNQAWEVLGDADRRADYDASLHDEGRDAPAQRAGPQAPAVPAAVLSLVDFYLCWHIFLLIVGVRVGTALPLGKAIGGVALTMLMWLSLQALPAFISSQFGTLSAIQPFF